MTPYARHILREFLAVFITSLGVVMFTLLMLDGIKVLLEQGLSPLHVVQIMPHLLPYAFRTAMQGAVLYSACYVFGRMAATHEMLALNSSGVSIRTVIWPVMVVATALSLFCVFLDDLGSTWGINGIRRFVHQATVDVAYNRLDRDRSLQADGFKLSVVAVQERRLIKPVAVCHPKPDEDDALIVADWGEITYDSRTESLTLTFYNGTITKSDGFKLVFQDRWTVELPTSLQMNRAVTLHRVCEQEAAIARLKATATKLAAQPIPLPLVDEPTTKLVSYTTERVDAEPETLVEVQNRIQAESAQLNSLRTHLHQKWSNSFCCLTFALIGIPAAVWMRRVDFLSSFFTGFLPIVLIYQPLQCVVFGLAIKETVSPWCLWVNNGILGAIGSALLWRICSKR